MVSVPDLAEVHERVDGGKEGTVEPATALRNEFRNGIWKRSAPSFEIWVGDLPGTSVSPVQLFTYFNTHLSSLLATNSQHRIRSSAKYMFAVKTSAF